MDVDRGERLAALFDAQHQRLYRLARRLVFDADEARDLVQETFLRAATARVPEAPGEAEAWLVRVLVNLCRDRGRRSLVRKRAHAVMVAEGAPAEPSAENAVLAHAVVHAALAALEPRRRAIVVLHELEDRDVSEIATLLGITRVTVRWHLAAARRELRSAIDGKERE